MPTVLSGPAATPTTTAIVTTQQVVHPSGIAVVVTCTKQSRQAHSTRATAVQVQRQIKEHVEVAVVLAEF